MIKSLYYIAGIVFFATVLVGQAGNPADGDWQEGPGGWIMAALGYVGLCSFAVAILAHWFGKSK
jgi:hypothetical protein